MIRSNKKIIVTKVLDYLRFKKLTNKVKIWLICQLLLNLYKTNKITYYKTKDHKI